MLHFFIKRQRSKQFFRIFLILILSLFGFFEIEAKASRISDGYLYEREFYYLGLDYLSLLEELPTDDLTKLPQTQRTACEKRYTDILSDGVIHIQIAVGYFDWTTGKEVGSYGLSPSMDPGAFSALDSIITDHCSGNLRLCGFKRDPSNSHLFRRDLNIFGKHYRAEIEMYYSSESEYYFDNIGYLKSQQKARTATMDSFFADGLQNSDAIFYFGHSRNGGGPDFAPPRLNRFNKVDYDGYYEIYRPGFKKLLQALSDPLKQTKILGLMSCDSRDHFLKPIRKAAVKTGVITSTAVLEINNVYTAMIGAIDALLRGQCQKSFYKELRMTPGNQLYITMDGMFE
jgi:hypothetical protein